MKFEDSLEERFYIREQLDWEHIKVLDDHIERNRQEAFAKGYELGKERGSDAMKSSMIVCCIATPIIVVVYCYIMAFSHNFFSQLLANLLGWPAFFIILGLPKIMYDHFCEKNGW